MRTDAPPLGCLLTLLLTIALLLYVIFHTN